MKNMYQIAICDDEEKILQELHKKIEHCFNTKGIMAEYFCTNESEKMLEYVVPFAFVNYFPAQYLLRKEDMALYNEAYMYIAPLVGVVIYLLAYAFWRISVKRYTSTGN